jgi:hypothetical protein
MIRRKKLFYINFDIDSTICFVFHRLRYRTIRRNVLVLSWTSTLIESMNFSSTSISNDSTKTSTLIDSMQAISFLLKARLTVKLISEDLFRNSWNFFFCFWLFSAFWEMKHLLVSMNLITLTDLIYFSPLHRLEKD